MSKVKRKMVSVSDRFDLYHFEGSLGSLLETVSGMVDKYGSDAALVLEHTGGYSYDEYEYSVTYSRPETDKELEKRLTVERKLIEKRKKEKLQKEEYERKELARLLKKYGES